MKPLICVPMGDPAGIGPEIVVRSASHVRLSEKCRLLVAGNIETLERAVNVCETPVTINTVESVIDLIDEPNVVNLFPVICPPQASVAFGEISDIAGITAYRCIEAAVRLALEEQVDAIATTPINKKSLRAAGVEHIGHTEILAELTNSPDPLTLFQVHGLRVFFLSRHLSLRQACDFITCERVHDCAVRAVAALRQLGVSEPRLAIAALNPHGGEDGLFGDEEIREIRPAVEQLRQDGFTVAGPLPADSVFHQALQGQYDAVISLYHDQGHIATKMVDFEKTISITCGLPFLRTSVDHGTAFDIAGKGFANPISMIEAIQLAAKYAVSMKVPL